VVLVCLAIGGAGLLAVPAEQSPPAPPPAAKPALQWREVAKLTRPEPIIRLTFGASGVAVADRGGALVLCKTDLADDPHILHDGVAGDGGVKARPADRLLFSTDGKWLYQIWNGGETIHRSPVSDLGNGPGLATSGETFHDLSPDGQTWLSVITHLPKFVLLRPNFWDQKAHDQPANAGVAFDHDVTRAVLSADNKWLAASLANGTVQLIERDGLKKGTILPVAGELAFSSDSGRLAVVGADAVTVFAHGTGVKLAALPAAAVAVAWHPEGNLLATAGADKMVRLWDVATGKPGQALAGHADAVTCVAFSPDGKRLASGSADKTARVWEFRR
jgi:WD40 repeat protein